MADGRSRYSVDIVVNLKTGEAIRGEKELDRVRAQMAKNAEKSEREVQRIREQTAKQAMAQERLMERSNKALNDARVREGKRAANELIRSLEQERKAADRSARDSSSSFSTFFGASFFGNLASRAVGNFIGKLQDIPAEAAKIAAETQNALKGLESVASFKGIDKQATADAVQNLRFVRGGIISVAEASTSLKNLLSTGFSLPEAITLMERFSDASAFGKQAALSYGDAIKGATEGIKNQNSVLVDNVGITKNLSVILKERGFELEDLSSKTQGAAARQALYNGLLVESQAQVGDADKVMQSYTGAVAGNDLAYQNLLRSIGDVMIQHPAVLESLKIQAEQYQQLTDDIKGAGKAQDSFANNTIKNWSIVKANAMNAGEVIFRSLEIVVRSVGLLVSGTFATVTLLIENSVNTSVDAINKLLGFMELSGIPQSLALLTGVHLPFGARVGKIDLGAKGFLKVVQEEINGIVSAFEKSEAALQRNRQNILRIEGSVMQRGDELSFERRAREMGAGTSTTRSTSTTGGDTAEAVKKVRAAKGIVDEVNKWSLSEFKSVNELFKQITGRNLPVTALGQTGLHNRLGLDHRNAVDVGISPGSAEGKILRQILEQLGVPFRALTMADKARGVKMTGEHFHIGTPSRAFGAKTESLRIDRDASALVGYKDKEGNARFIPKWALENLAANVSDIRDRAGITASPATVQGVEGLLRTDRTLTPDQLMRQDVDDQFSEQARALILRQKNFAAEISDIWKQSLYDREHRELDLIRSITEAEASLSSLRHEAADDHLTEQRRLLSIRNEELDLTHRLIQLQDEAATAGANDGLRQQVALLEALNELRRADTDAIESQIRSQVRLSDATIYHADQANAAVMEYLASQRSVTEVITDFRIGTIETTFSLIDRGLERFTSRLGIMGDLVKDLISGFARLALSKFFQSLNGGGSGGGGGGGFSLGGFLGSIFGGGGRGTPNFNPNAGGGGSFLSRLLGGGGAASPVSASALPTANLGLGGIISQMPSSVAYPGATGAAGGFSLAGLAPMLPLLGMGLGAGLGRGSLGGSVLGGLGGLALGGAGAVGLLGGSGAAIFGTGGALSSFGGAAALLTNPFTIAGGIGLLIGAAILGRNAARRRDERTRDALSNDTGTAIWQLIKQAQQGRLGVAEARTQFDQVMARYDQGVAQIKDSKTRRIAELTRSHFTALWPILEQNARQADSERALAKNFRETYSVPGFDLATTMSGLSGGSASPLSMPSSAGSVFMPPPSFSPPTMPSFSPPAFNAPSFSAPSSGSSGASGGPLGGMSVSVMIDKDGMADVVLSHPRFGEQAARVAVKAVGEHARNNPSGLPKAFENSLKKQRGER